MESVDSYAITQDNYRIYSKYVIETRAYPGLVDGCKAVQRRTIHCSYKYLPRKKVKSVNAIGEIVKLHPHPNSIYGVIVSMASEYDCAFPLFDTKGNFGGLGHPAAAERYTEVMISDLAIKIFESFSDYVDMKLGDMDINEPEYLATMLPLCFLHGTYGIPTGMSTVNIPPLNPIDMIKYYMEVLKSRDTSIVPNVIVKPNIGNISIASSKDEWKKMMEQGQGSILYKPTMEIVDNKTIVITGVHPSRSFANVTKILNQELARDQIDVRDETTTSTRYVVEIPPYRRVNINEVFERLMKGLTARESYRFIFADKGVAVFSGFHGAVKSNIDYLIECCKRKFDNELKNLKYKLDVLKTIEMMKKDKNVLKLIQMSTEEAVKFISSTYEITVDQAKSVLGKPLSYMTKEHLQEISSIEKEIDTVNNNNSDIFKYLLDKYKDLLSDVKRFTKGKEFTRFS